jgi:hypothetical protein
VRKLLSNKVFKERISQEKNLPREKLKDKRIHDNLILLRVSFPIFVRSRKLEGE